jgi:hypothetical protein
MKTKPLIALATSISVFTAMLPLDLAYAGGSRWVGHSYSGNSSHNSGCRNGYRSSNTGYHVDNSKNYHVDNSKNYHVDNSKN